MNLKILHFTPYYDGESSFSSHLSLLLAQMGKKAVVNLVTLSPVSQSSPDYQHQSIGTGKKDYGRHGVVNLLALQKRFLHILYGMMPDIVHIHGSYNFISSRIELWSRKRGFPVVFSSYGGMNPEFIDAQYGTRTWKMICYQKEMVRGAKAMQLSDTKEGEYLVEQKLTNRVSMVSDPRTDEYTDYEEMAADTLDLYHKVLDSDMGTKLDQNSREAISALLHLSLAGNEEHKPLCAEDILNLRAMSPRKWRNLLLYADEQGVLSIVYNGIERAQLKMPSIDMSSVSRFSPQYAKSINPLPSSSLIAPKRIGKSFDKKVQRCGEVEKSICYMLQNLKYLISHNSLTLKQLCDIYAVYRHDAIDEVMLDKILQELRLHTFARRISQILKETIYLADGFMPVPALNDKGTERIRKILVKY